MTATLSRDEIPFGSNPFVRDDDAHRRWLARAWQPDRSVTRAQLLTHAQNRIAELTNRDAPGRALGWQPVHRVVAQLAMSLLEALITGDDLATPQVAPTPEGGINIEWLVSGDALSVTVDLEGLSIEAHLDNGEYAFAPRYWDYGANQEALIRELRQVLPIASRFLDKISTGIQHRLPLK